MRVERGLWMMPASAAYTLLTGLLLWPPGLVYWILLTPLIGDKPTLAIVFTLSGAVGATYSIFTRVPSMDYVAGGALAYVAGMTAVELTLSPSNTNYILTYALILVTMYVGFAAETLFSATNSEQ